MNQETDELAAFFAACAEIHEPVRERARREAELIDERTLILVGSLVGGHDPVEALLAAIGEEVGLLDGERVYREVFKAWDATRRDGLVNPEQPGGRYGSSARWKVAEHLLDEIGVQHPADELATIGSHYTRMRGDEIQGIVVEIANANRGVLAPRRANGPVRYWLERSDEEPWAYEWSRGGYKSEVERPREWTNAHVDGKARRL